MVWIGRGVVGKDVGRGEGGTDMRRESVRWWLASVPLVQQICAIFVLFTYDTSMKFGTVSGAFRKNFGYRDIAGLSLFQHAD